MTAGSLDEQRLTWFPLDYTTGAWISDQVSGNAMRHEVKTMEDLSVVKYDNGAEHVVNLS